MKLFLSMPADGKRTARGLEGNKLVRTFRKKNSTRDGNVLHELEESLRLPSRDVHDAAPSEWDIVHGFARSPSNSGGAARRFADGHGGLSTNRTAFILV